MKINICKTLWGVETFYNYNFQSWKQQLNQFKQQGFNGLEVAVQFFCGNKDQQKDFMKLCKEQDLILVTQIHSMGYPIKSNKVQDHREDLEQKIEECKNIWSAVAINCHSGKDSLNFDQNVELFFGLAQIQQEHKDITINHETHRQRSLFNPFIFRDVMFELQRLKVDKLININADISHWVLACERLFNESSTQDQDEWPQILQLLKNHTKQIHARIGSPQQIQLINPFTKYHEEELTFYDQLWIDILKHQKSNNNHSFYITCEFGPNPYQILNPFCNLPYYSLEQNNLDMLRHLKTHVLPLV